MADASLPIKDGFNASAALGGDLAAGTFTPYHIAKVYNPASGTFVFAQQSGGASPAQEGTDASGVSAPSGGAGIRGWLSGIFAGIGTVADSAWSGSGAGSLVAVMKSIALKSNPGLGAMSYVPSPTGSAIPLGTAPAGATGVRFYLASTDTVTFTINPTAPTFSSLTMSVDTAYDTTTQKFGGAALVSGVGASAGFIPTNGTWSAECWVKQAGALGGLAAEVAMSQAGVFWFGASGDGTAVAHYGFGSEIVLTSTAAVCDGSWHHMALVSNGSSGVTLWVDGRLAASNAAPLSGQGPNYANRFLLRDIDFDSTTVNLWRGSVDEAAVFSTAKYTVPFTPPVVPYLPFATGLLALYHLDGNGFNSATNPSIPTYTINGATSGPNWDEKLAAGQNVYITATSGNPAFRWY